MGKPYHLLLTAALTCALLFASCTTRAPEVSPTPEPSAPAQAEPTPSATPKPAPTPTPTSTPEPTPEPQPEGFVISFVGDCTLASSQHNKGSSRAFETIVGTDYAFPFAETAEYFKNDYLSIANMEGTFTAAESSNGGTFTFKSDPGYAQVFAEGGIELVVLGNNHSMDYGERGAQDTKDALDAAGVCWAGDGGTFVYRQDDGLAVGVYSKLYPTAEDVKRGVKALQEAGAELIVAALHWGVEGSYRPTADQVSVGHAAIDAGADIVYGSHPHVLQKVEEYGGGMILHSLGNWSFGGNTSPRDRDTAIIQITAVREADGGVSLGGVELIPCELSSEPSLNNYQPHLYEPGSKEYERAMSKLDGTFTGPDLVVDYSAFHNNGEGAGTGGEEQGSAEGEQSGVPEQSGGGEPPQEGGGINTEPPPEIEAPPPEPAAPVEPVAPAAPPVETE